MITVTIFLKRRGDLNYQQFMHYLQFQHRPLFAALPEIQQYVLSYHFFSGIDAKMSSSDDDDFESTIRLSFANMKAMMHLFNSVAYNQTIRADQEKFMDLQRSTITIATGKTAIA